MNAIAVLSAPFAEISARTFHDIVQLRVDTFIVEQDCPYRELDGRDLLPTTLHLWIEQGGQVVAYLRTYPGADGATWIGRVVTAARHRNRGLGGRLMGHALASAPRPVRISAQARLEAWYAGFGFVRSGDDFLEDGIAHTPMRLDGGSGAGEQAADHVLPGEHDRQEGHQQHSPQERPHPPADAGR